MLAGEILRSFYAHTELATCDYECDSTPDRQGVQYLYIPLVSRKKDAFMCFLSGIHPLDRKCMRKSGNCRLIQW